MKPNPLKNIGKFLLSSLALMLGSGVAATSHAQSADVQSADVHTCNVRGTVTLTVVGIATVYPISCVNKTERQSDGMDEDALTGTQSINLPVLADLAAVSAPYGRSEYDESAQTTRLNGFTSGEAVMLGQGLVESSAVGGKLNCVIVDNTDLVACTAATSIGALSIDGQPVTVPSQPIPLNYTIPVSGLDVVLNVAGIPVLVSNLSGSVKLNYATLAINADDSIDIEHAPIALKLNGSTSVLGIGLVSVQLELLDDTQQKIVPIGQLLGSLTPGIFGSTLPGGN